ncbi:hypothetical protein [Sinosporangium siamense]|uniref:hypothetical protein n=1 Tax=Sinosporangium siamense TaxID=1367973 RepID=UPI0036D2341E
MPYVAVKGDKIKSIAFGRQRTPSPLIGGKMGDHTGSWASVVDSVHSLLYDKPVKEAVGLLHEKQRRAQAWMSDDGSPGMKLWKTLDFDDQENRQGSLEHYAHQVDSLLKQAADALNRPLIDEASREAAARAPGLLSEAMGYHLAYLNFLPYATVPAGSQTGSKGAGEGSARAEVLEIESNPGTALSSTERETARENLWGLFSTEAAVREAAADRAVSPKKMEKISGHIDELVALSGEVEALLSGFLAPGASRVQVATAVGGDISAFNAKVMKLKDKAEKLSGTLSTSEYAKIREMPTQIKQTLNTLSDLTLGKTAVGTSSLMRPHADLKQSSDGLKELKNWLVGDADNAREESALILARLLYDHQTAVAEAYPNAVKESEFLTFDAADKDRPTDAAGAAVGMLKRYLAADKGMEAEDDAIEKLGERVAALHATLGPRPTPAADSKWVADSSTESLVVSFRGDELVIVGRAAAPYGVAGMGSHTTAWVDEVDAVKRLVAKSKKGEITKQIAKEVAADLKGAPLRGLASLLPAEQLDGGQLSAVFNAAANVMAARSPEESIKAYLSFRNLLPYATVDAGDRAGHGERSGGRKKSQFDKESLQAAIDLKVKELDGDDVASTTEAMEKAAQSLTDILDDIVMADPDADPADSTPSWTDYPEVEDAARAVIDDLTAKARGLADGKLKAKALGSTIMKIRDDEDTRVRRLWK